jgi:hypothetical protein
MKSCYVNVDKLIGVVELETPDDIIIGDRVISTYKSSRNQKRGVKEDYPKSNRRRIK